ncbi:hypothetical protein R1flu_000611 [Riccia fluitans]|uniref:Uncharacterized protein n=1 Tax=Riccia fluitans TaxID=41844 RepID=A0ABD1Y0X8_9MARC
MAAEAEQRTEVVRLKKEALQQQYTKDKAEWETKNTHLSEEATQNTDEAPKLKWELEAKEEELKRLQEADKKIRQGLKVARRKGRELEDELKTMPPSIVMRDESKTLELIRSSKKWQISSYPSMFDPTVGTGGHWGHRYLAKNQVLPLLMFIPCAPSKRRPWNLSRMS